MIHVITVYFYLAKCTPPTPTPPPSPLGFPCGSEGKEIACHALDLASVPGSGRPFGGGNGNPPQYSCLENHMDREAWWATVRGVTKPAGLQSMGLQRVGQDRATNRKDYITTMYLA